MSNPFDPPQHSTVAEITGDVIVVDEITANEITLSDTVYEDLRVGSASTEAIPGVIAPTFSQLSSDGLTPIDFSALFEAAQFFTIPANPIFDLNYTPITGLGWTVAVWAKQLLRVSNQNILQRTSGTGDFEIRINGSNGRVRVDNGPTAISFNAATTLPLNARVCLIITAEPDPVNIGREIISVYTGDPTVPKDSRDNLAPTVDTPLSNMNVACDNDGNAEFFFGQLDELRVWNKALDLAERQAYYNSNLGTTDPIAAANTLVRYAFNGDFTDSSGNGIDGVLPIPPLQVPDFSDGLVSSTLPGLGVYLPFFQPGMTESLHFQAQLPHSWKEGSPIEPHIHFACSDNSVGEVRWVLEYTIADFTPPSAVASTALSTFGTTVSLTSDARENQGQNVHSVASFGEIDMTGRGISTMLICRIYRDTTDTYPLGVFFQEIGFHYEVDSLGSQERYVK